MRAVLAALVLFGAAALTAGQDPKKDDDIPVKDVGPRYGVKPRVKAYPQVTPKEALRSVISAIDRADYAYLTAQLIDPMVVDVAVEARVNQFAPAVTTELVQLREYQRANPDKVNPDNRVPFDGPAFSALVTERARERGFRQVVRDLESKLANDPVAVKELRRVLRDGAFADSAPVAAATHPDIKGRAVYFKKIGERWFLENRNTEEPKK